MSSIPKLPKLLSSIIEDFPEYNFRSGDTFSWSADAQTITYDPSAAHALWLMLHELGHAELAHKTYHLDIELLKYESAAWEQAKILGKRYGQQINNGYIQDNLDTYRNWLHARSICPHCNQIGFQRKKNTYSCVNCRYSWRVNGAKQCQLKRVTLRVQNRPV